MDDRARILGRETETARGPELERLLAVVRSHVDDQFSPPLVHALGDLLGAGEAAVDELASVLPTLESGLGAGLLCVWFGARVENGADPTRSTDAVAGVFRNSLELAGRPLQLVGQGLVAHLGRDEAARQRLGADPELLEHLESHDDFGAWWVHDALTRRSGTLLVLDPVLREGIRVRYHHLSSCFHLFTLLQDVLPAPWKRGRENAAAAATARHEGGQEGDSAWFHFGQPTHPRMEMAGSVWGEAGLDSIATVDGEQTLILWPSLLGGRSWDAGFFGLPLEAFPPFVELAEPPDPDRLATWWERLDSPPR